MSRTPFVVAVALVAAASCTTAQEKPAAKPSTKAAAPRAAQAPNAPPAAAPAPAAAEAPWPPEGVVLFAYDSLEYQTASARAFLKACEGAFPQTHDCIEIDRQSEAGGPIALATQVPVADVKTLLKPSLACPGRGVIPARCVELEIVDGQLMFSLVGLTDGGPQPLAMGTYLGDLRSSDGHHVALLKVQVVQNVP